MKHLFIVLMAVCILTETGPVSSQDRKCTAFENEKDSLNAEDLRLKSVFAASVGKPEIPKDICKVLADQIKFNSRFAFVAMKCVDEGFSGFRDLATNLDQENKQVYMKTAAQYDCQRFSN